MAEVFKLTGGCQCGAVRYTISAPAKETVHCHCSMCRKVHGAMFVTFSEIPGDAFHIDRGADNLTNFESSAGNARYFCRSCGGPIYTKMPDSSAAYISTGTLDAGAHPGHPEGKQRHIFVGSKAPWYEIADDLPKAEVY